MSGAGSPEELDMLLEDAFVLRDEQALVDLFDSAAVLGAAANGRQSVGLAAVTGLIGDIWAGGGEYLARPLVVLQSGRTALLLTGRSVHVARRGPDGWRFLISWMDG